LLLFSAEMDKRQALDMGFWPTLYTTDCCR